MQERAPIFKAIIRRIIINFNRFLHTSELFNDFTIKFGSSSVTEYGKYTSRNLLDCGSSLTTIAKDHFAGI